MITQLGDSRKQLIGDNEDKTIRLGALQHLDKLELGSLSAEFSTVVHFAIATYEKVRKSPRMPSVWSGEKPSLVGSESSMDFLGVTKRLGPVTINLSLKLTCMRQRFNNE